MLAYTQFDSIFDNKTNKRLAFKDWDAFVSHLERLSKLEGYKPKKGERFTKKPSPLISPALFKKGTTRANANVAGWKGWSALDIDEYDGTFEEVIKPFAEFDYVCYSTASSRKEHPKFRMVLRLNHDVQPSKIKHLWYALNKELNENGDPQTKDLSRMYYVPAQYPDAFNFFHVNRGECLNVEDIMRKHEYVETGGSFISKLPPAMQAAILNHRKSTLTNTKFKWTSYRDCPFISKKMLAEYKSMANVDGTGRYSKMYAIMVNIASNATKSKYPITPKQIADLCRELDNDTAGIYKKRPLEVEAGRALEYILGSTL